MFASPNVVGRTLAVRPLRLSAFSWHSRDSKNRRPPGTSSCGGSTAGLSHRSVWLPVQSRCCEQVWELMHALERWVQFLEIQLPAPIPVVGAQDRATRREAAEALRSQWGIKLNEPFPHLTRTAEANGIVVVFATFASDAEAAPVSAFSTNKLSRPIVVTPPDRVDDVYRHRFNLAHELGHFALHQDEVHGDIEIVREADAFAGGLLLPEEAVRTLLQPRIEWDRVAQLSETVGCEDEGYCSPISSARHALRRVSAPRIPASRDDAEHRSSQGIPYCSLRGRDARAPAPRL